MLLNITGLPVIRVFNKLRILMTDKTVRMYIENFIQIEIIDEIFLILKNNLFKTSEKKQTKV